MCIRDSILRDPSDALLACKPGDKTVRLYFCGAPSTTRMLTEPFRFVPFDIPEVEWVDETTITTVCVAVPRNGGAVLSAKELDNLKAYHDRVFKVAIESHADLINVWWAYNRYAERKQHSATFKSPEVFAKCLTDHHAPV